MESFDTKTTGTASKPAPKYQNLAKLLSYNFNYTFVNSYD